MFWARLFQTRFNIVVAICDEELLDKEIKFKELSIKVSKHFYGERLIDEVVAMRAMKKATIGNLIGKKIVELAEKNGFITKENIILINDIPHAQFVKI